ncbi:MAG: radical SAM protein [Nitrospirae bacterium]|nr:radical SAM protein [Nitrospirota bacterium]
MGLSNDNVNELIPRTEAIKHIIHRGSKDPNKIIYDYYVSHGDTQKAQRFLQYREVWESIRKGEKSLDFPPHVAFALSDACNLHCAHCYRVFNKDRTLKRRMEFDEIFKLIDECKEIGVHSINLGTESEMFLYDSILEVMAHIGSKRFEDFWVCTNGTLLNDEKINVILNSGVTRLSVSIDAVSNETYNKVRGKHFYKLMSNIFNFLDRREKRGTALPVLRVTMIKSNLTINECDDFIRFWSKIADEVDIQPLIDIKNIDLLKYDYIQDPYCNYPWTMIYINWNGDYKPCCSEFCKHLTIGNIKDMSIKDAWNSPYMIDLRRQFVEKKVNKYCTNCLRSLNSGESYSALSTG